MAADEADARTLAGYIEATDGRMRVYSAAEPRRFDEVDRDQVERVDRTDDDLVGSVQLKQGAVITSGELDPETFASFFTTDGRPAEKSPLRGETGYPRCYSWNPPGGGGFC